MWKNIYINGISVGLAILLLPNFSFLDQYSITFMPDFLSFLLVLLAVGLSWKKTRFLSSFLLSSLGMLIKPTSVIVLALFFLHPNFKISMYKNVNLRNWFYKSYIWILLSIFIVYLYYVPTLDYIIHHVQSVSHFKVELNNPLLNLKEFWSWNGGKWYYLLTQHLFSHYGFYLTVLTLLWVGYKKHLFINWNIWIILALQFFAISALDGFHTYNHIYYFISVSLLPALVYLYAWKHCQFKFIQLLFTLALLLNLSYIVPYELSLIYEKQHGETVVFYSDCQKIIINHPEIQWKQNYIFQADPQEINAYPYIGVCFGERIGIESAQYGLYRTGESIPENCRVIDTSQNIKLTKCNI